MMAKQTETCAESGYVVVKVGDHALTRKRGKCMVHSQRYSCVARRRTGQREEVAVTKGEGHGGGGAAARSQCYIETGIDGLSSEI
jgi:hypothetical protein